MAQGAEYRRGRNGVLACCISIGGSNANIIARSGKTPRIARRA